MTTSVEQIVSVKMNDQNLKDFCSETGALILWANLIDGQLNRAMMGLYALPEHPLIEPIVAQLDARPKIELLKKGCSFIPADHWRKPILKWVERTEDVNKHRNIVAHHGIKFIDGEIWLSSDQLGKILATLTIEDGDIKPKRARNGVAEVRAWNAKAKEVYEEGIVILKSLVEMKRQLAERASSSAA